MRAQHRTVMDGIGRGQARRVTSSVGSSNFRMRDISVQEKQDEEEEKFKDLENQISGFQAYFKWLFIIVGIICTIIFFVILALVIGHWFTGAQEIEEQINQLKEELKKDMVDQKAVLKEEIADQKFVLREDILKSIPKPPQLSVCSFQDSWKNKSSTITYDSIFSEFSNGDHGSLNKKTGIFTATTPGQYTAVFSADAICDKYRNTTIYVYLHLWRNGQRVTESRWLATNEGSGHRSYDQGSRTIILNLRAGDTIKLKTEKEFETDLRYITLCITLTGWDL